MFIILKKTGVAQDTVVIATASGTVDVIVSHN